MTDSSKPTPHRVFISYANEDAPSANRLRRLCDKAGLSTWWDRDLKVGENWRDRIEEEIDKSDLFLILLSNSLSSTEATPKEWSSICERSWRNPNVRLIPIRLNAVEPPSFLRHTHFIDALDLNLTRCVEEIGELSKSLPPQTQDVSATQPEEDAVERFRTLAAAVAREGSGPDGKSGNPK